MFLSNQLTARGNLGADPEMKYTTEGKLVVSFRMAVSNRKRDRDTGNYVDDTWWIRVTVFGTEAERAKDLHKGSKVVVWGRCGTPTIYHGQNGDGISTDLIANDIMYLDPRPQNEHDASGLPWDQRQPAAASATPARGGLPRMPAEDDELTDIPF